MVAITIIMATDNLVSTIMDEKASTEVSAIIMDQDLSAIMEGKVALIESAKISTETLIDLLPTTIIEIHHFKIKSQETIILYHLKETTLGLLRNQMMLQKSTLKTSVIMLLRQNMLKNIATTAMMKRKIKTSAVMNKDEIMFSLKTKMVLKKSVLALKRVA